MQFLTKTQCRGRLGLNRGPLNLQSNALPLSYTPLETHCSAAFGSIAKWHSLRNICIFSYWQLHCWCSGIMQDSHSCDSGSIPGQCNKILPSLKISFIMCQAKNSSWGGTQVWTGDLSICSRMLYHWAIPP